MASKEKYSVFNLNQSHKELFTKYLSYVKNKQNSFIKEILSEIDDFKEDK